MATITAHCLIKNEENFVWYAVKSVIDYVDQIFIFDTGSTDATVEIIKKLFTEYPDKIIFEEKGECDKERHTLLRQEMIDRTITDWFMILDGDEVWTKRGIEEALLIINNSESKGVECLIAPFYLCVGDLQHYSLRGLYGILGQSIHATPRFLKLISNVHWAGKYNEDSLFNGQNEIFFNKKNSVFLKNKFWHVSHLMRSTKDEFDYSSGGGRRTKIKKTYFMIGKKNKEPLPEVFDQKIIKKYSISFLISFINFFIWTIKKVTKIGI